MRDLDYMAGYYVGVRGRGQGSVRSSVLGDDGAIARYEVADEDVLNLSNGLARLAMLLLAAGAEEIYPAVQGLAPITTEKQAIRWLDERLPTNRISLTTVHAFSSCPIGERADRCAADSYGKLFGWDNLYVNDASMLPDSPGVFCSCFIAFSAAGRLAPVSLPLLAVPASSACMSVPGVLRVRSDSIVGLRCSLASGWVSGLFIRVSS